jgi:hypothetical protein
MPRLWPDSVRTNSHVDVSHTFIVRSPEADTMYLEIENTVSLYSLLSIRVQRDIIWQKVCS